MRYVELQRRGDSPLLAALTPETIAALCRRAFGATTQVAAVQLLRSGRFNTTYRVALAGGRAVILRVAPPPAAHLFSHESNLLRRECAVHRHLRQAARQVPRLLFQDFSQQLLPRDYVFLECLPGRLWDEVQGSLSPRQNEALWRQLGGLVRAIHKHAGASYGRPGSVTGFACWSAAMLADIDGLIGDLRQLGLDTAAADRFRTLALGHAPLLDRCGPPRLLHGDLWPKNILVDTTPETPVITGLLDAERTRWGDPAAEWIFGFLAIPETFWAAYGADLSGPALAPEACLRRHIYNGRGALQLILEAWRWQLDDGFARRILEDSSAALSSEPPIAARPISEEDGSHVLRMRAMHGLRLPTHRMPRIESPSIREGGI